MRKPMGGLDVDEVHVAPGEMEVGHGPFAADAARPAVRIRIRTAQHIRVAAFDRLFG
ncbi:MAG: hypothetical protein NVS4B2_23280 [Chloroflexota bacterium]